MTQINKFPFDVNLRQFESKSKIEVKKLVRFFNYIGNYEHGYIYVYQRGEYLVIAIRNARVTVDHRGDFEIRAVGLLVEIFIDRQSGEIEIYGDANGYMFEIKVKGEVEVKTKDNKVLIKLTPESIPQIIKK